MSFSGGGRCDFFRDNFSDVLRVRPPAIVIAGRRRGLRAIAVHRRTSRPIELPQAAKPPTPQIRASRRQPRHFGDEQCVALPVVTASRPCRRAPRRRRVPGRRSSAPAAIERALRHRPVLFARPLHSPPALNDGHDHRPAIGVDARNRRCGGRTSVGRAPRSSSAVCTARFSTATSSTQASRVPSVLTGPS